jgi:beta-keto acid cleavage enzyme
MQQVIEQPFVTAVRKLILDGIKVRQVERRDKHGFAANGETTLYPKTQLPKDIEWTGFGIGRIAFPMVAQSWILGGNVRIGMEDTVHIAKGKLTSANAELATGFHPHLTPCLFGHAFSDRKMSSGSQLEAGRAHQARNACLSVPE